MNDLAAWLLEQIAEDERRCGTEDPSGLSFCDADEGSHYTAARVLAECEAKRRIIESQQDAARSYDESDDHWAGGEADGLDHAMRLLALPYADRPGYREEWRP